MPPVQELDDRTLAEAVRRVIESLAAAGGYVILGRGAQCALADRGDALHVSLVGTLEDRARRVAEWQHIDEHEASHRCRDIDAERAGYVKRYYGRDIRDPELYDVVVNTSRMSLGDAAAVAVATAGQRFGPA